jgi:hypothetical protein
MASGIATFFAKRYILQPILLTIIRFIGDRAGNYFKRDDPYYEATEDTPGVKPPFLQNSEGRPTNRSRGKSLSPLAFPKKMPKSLKRSEDELIEWVPPNSSQSNLDRSLTCCCCGFRIGWSAVIGVIPVIGDLLDMLIALSIIRLCMEVGLPKTIVYSFSSIY